MSESQRGDAGTHASSSRHVDRALPSTEASTMGLLDKMFGGGTNLTLALDTGMIPEGGTLSGNITLSGGKKPLKLTALKVRLVYVKVTPVPNQTLPKIEIQTLLDNT